MTSKNNYGSIFTKEMLSDRICGQNKNQMGIDMASIYDFEVETIDRKKISMKQFEGKALIIVNTASRCGFTPHYEELEKLYRTYKDQGFEVLGFPCNQFGGQEPGNEQEIKLFCQKQYQVTFPMFSKVLVNGPSAHPLFQYLTKELPGLLGSRSVKWNFTKFLIDPKGTPLKRFATRDRIHKIIPHLEALWEGSDL